MSAPSVRPDAADKDQWRRWAIARRRTRSDADRLAAQVANRGHLLELGRKVGRLCAFLPLPSEPLDPGLLDDLAVSGVEVLIPRVRADAPLDWCRFPSPLIHGAFGIAEPTGPGLGPEAIATADIVLVPAFAVDRRGVRLGRGGGHYDRSLALLDGPSRRIAVLFDGEFVDQLPADPHDVPVTAFVAPGQGVVPLIPPT